MSPHYYIESGLDVMIVVVEIINDGLRRVRSYTYRFLRP